MPHNTTNRPEVGRPHVPGYGIPSEVEGTLPWDHVVERMAQARNYWLATAQLDGVPHAVPVWGVWVAGTLYFGGGPQTRWSRNLAANPRVVVHLDDSEKAVILEGTVTRIADPDDPLVARLDDAYEAKYAMRHGIPFWVLRPHKAFAWTRFPDDATRWTFE
ncbi:MAG: DUF2255 family protein [Anaerolineae bacterium]|nr:DUF2255 family protein [Anaerolineae bacterium]